MKKGTRVGFVQIAEGSYNITRTKMHEHVNLILPILTGLGVLATFWGITWKLGQDMDGKVVTIYKRFDVFKKNVEATHVRKEVCAIMHEQLSADMQEVKKDVKELLKLANGRTQ